MVERQASSITVNEILVKGITKTIDPFAPAQRGSPRTDLAASSSRPIFGPVETDFPSEKYFHRSMILEPPKKEFCYGSDRTGIQILSGDQMKTSIFLVLCSLAFAVSAHAGQPSSCDDAKSLKPDVFAKAKQHLSAGFLKNASFSTDTDNIEYDNSKRGGELWTVYVTSPTGHAAIRVHVTADDGACRVD